MKRENPGEANVTLSHSPRKPFPIACFATNVTKRKGFGDEEYENKSEKMHTPRLGWVTCRFAEVRPYLMHPTYTHLRIRSPSWERHRRFKKHIPNRKLSDSNEEGIWSAREPTSKRQYCQPVSVQNLSFISFSHSLTSLLSLYQGMQNFGEGFGSGIIYHWNLRITRGRRSTWPTESPSGTIWTWALGKLSEYSPNTDTSSLL